MNSNIKSIIINICKFFILCIITWVIVTILLSPMLLAISPIHVSKEKIIKSYLNNPETFLTVAKYMENVIWDISIDKKQGKDFIVKVSKNHRIESMNITDNRVNEDILFIMYKLKYEGIDEMGNSIYFLRQTGLRFEQGLAYSKDGNKPDWPPIQVLEPIGDGWYYYESK